MGAAEPALHRPHVRAAQGLLREDSRQVLLEPEAYPRDRHPALTYLARLRPSGRRSQRAALDTIAGFCFQRRLGFEQLPWHRLRYPAHGADP